MALIKSSKLLNLAGTQQSWYRIRNAVDGGPVQVHIYDEIGYVGVTAQQFLADIEGLEQFELHLNTPGGEVYDGIAIYEALKARGGVPIVVDSLAASIGSVIAMAGDPLVMAKNSSLMIHDGFSMACGNAADMRKMADLLDMASDTIADIYAEKSGKPADHWRGLMRAETWFKAQQAVDAGLADQVKGQDQQATWNLADFGYVPEKPQVMDAKVVAQPLPSVPAETPEDQPDPWAEFVSTLRNAL